MCYLHVKYNVRKVRNNLIPKAKYNVMKDITDLHDTLSKDSYVELLEITLARWQNDESLESFHDYFVDTWVNSPFNKWQLFWTKAGMSHTNTPIESYNNQIKTSFTRRVKHHMIR